MFENSHANDRILINFWLNLFKESNKSFESQSNRGFSKNSSASIKHTYAIKLPDKISDHRNQFLRRSFC